MCNSFRNLKILKDQVTVKDSSKLSDKITLNILQIQYQENMEIYILGCLPLFYNQLVTKNPAGLAFKFMPVGKYFRARGRYFNIPDIRFPEFAFG